MKQGVIIRASLTALVFVSLFFSLAQAEDYTSTNFILRDPVITIEGGRSTSTNFEYFSSSGQTATGENTSASFIERSGFLYFPVATSSVVSATAGNGQVSLTWTASVGTLANITDYQVGTATVSGGTYTFESVGDVVSFTDTGLTNDTTYYFVVRSFAGTLRLAESAEVSATPVVPSLLSVRGGGGSLPPLTASVVFSGRAYPVSTVTLLKDAQVAGTTIAESDATFTTTLSGLSAGSYIFSLYSEDKDGRRSSLLTFSVRVTRGSTTNVSGIFIAPTIDIDKTEVKQGEDITIFGQSLPQANILIRVSSGEDFFATTVADKDGFYLYHFDTTVLDYGAYTATSKASIKNQLVSSFGRVVDFLVGTKTIVKTKEEVLKGDLNNDGRVNLVDFSILIYWFDRPDVPVRVDLNGDGKSGFVDFSIMAYYWTG